jgi:FkbM family methyltransferase
MVLRRIGDTTMKTVREGTSAWRLCRGVPSATRLSTDVVLYRALRVARLRTENRPRSIRLRTGGAFTYRLNRGDIQSIREVLMDEAYRLPFAATPRVIVDLGANIGLTSLYMAHRFRPEVLVAVEPDTANAALARHNLTPLGGSVIQAAIGPRDGVARFVTDRASNLGHLRRADDGPSVADGAEVEMISMPTLLEKTGIETIDLLKLDIEGGEEALLSGDTSWLQRVRAIIAEFHPTVVDYPRMIQRLVDNGFRYIAADSAWPGSMDAFVRP